MAAYLKITTHHATDGVKRVAHHTADNLYELREMVIAYAKDLKVTRLDQPIPADVRNTVVQNRDVMAGYSWKPVTKSDSCLSIQFETMDRLTYLGECMGA
jgi:hypothetical protein